MTLLLLLSRPLDRLEEEEEKEPTDEASDQPSVTTVNSNAKYGEDSKSTVAAACSRGCCWRGSPDPVHFSPFFLDLDMKYFILSFFVGYV